MVEMQFRDVPQAKAHGQFVPQVGAGMFQCGQRFALFPLGPRTATRTLAWRPSAETCTSATSTAKQPRVVGFEADDFGKLLAYRFGDA